MLGYLPLTTEAQLCQVTKRDTLACPVSSRSLFNFATNCAFFSNFIMKLSIVLASGLLATVASAFQHAPHSASHHAARVQPLSSMATATVNIQENAQRDVFSMEQWTRNCGVQTCEGFQLTSQDGMDYSVVTNQDLPAGSPVLFAPAQMILSSSAIQDEMGGNLEASENALANLGETNRLPLFRLMVKILVEYENGDQSPYYPWLNALPRLFFNGVAMTDACFDCLPPYVSWLSQKERNNYAKFLNALRKGYSPLSQQTIDNDQLIKWAYNVALTRHQVVVAGKEKKITPLADMLNHGTFPNCEITYDPEGNCMVTTMTDVPAGSPLTITLGDPSNPSPLFATYGFLDNDCPTVFCKAMHLQEEMEEMKLGFKDLLFATQTGDIAPQVWDLFLYKLLKDANDPNLPAFFEACTSGNEGSKQEFHGQYFPYTLNSLKEHVNNIIQTVDSLSMKANSYDLSTHPRVPAIVAHNNLVKDTFLRVKNQLDAMG